MLRLRPVGRARVARWALIAIGPALLAAPAIARAQSTAHPPADEHDRAARAEFLAGRDAFAHGAFGEAARRFEHAYELSGRAQLLYNIGTAYDRLHEWRRARTAWAGYLDAVPNAPEGDEVRARLVVIEQEIAREHLVGVADLPPVPVAGLRERIIVRTAPSDPHAWRTAALVVGTLAVVSGGLSGVLALVTNPYYAGLVSSCGVDSPSGAGCPQPDLTDIQLRATLINVSLVTSLVLAAGAVALLGVDLTRQHPPATTTSTTTTRAATVRFPRWNASVAPLAGGGGVALFSGAL